jgi:hypothetical protein
MTSSGRGGLLLLQLLGLRALGQRATLVYPIFLAILAVTEAPRWVFQYENTIVDIIPLGIESMRLDILTRSGNYVQLVT